MTEYKLKCRNIQQGIITPNHVQQPVHNLQMQPADDESGDEDGDGDGED